MQREGFSEIRITVVEKQPINLTSRERPAVSSQKVPIHMWSNYTVSRMIILCFHPLWNVDRNSDYSSGCTKANFHPQNCMEGMHVARAIRLVSLWRKRPNAGRVRNPFFVVLSSCRTTLCYKPHCSCPRSYSVEDQKREASTTYSVFFHGFDTGVVCLKTWKMVNVWAVLTLSTDSIYIDLI